MYAPTTYEIVAETEHTVALDDGSELSINQTIERYHCAECLCTLGYKDDHHGVQCNRCGGQSLIANSDWRRYLDWAQGYIESASDDDYLAQMLRAGLEHRHEDIAFVSTHTFGGSGGTPEPLPAHLRRGG